MKKGKYTTISQNLQQQKKRANFKKLMSIAITSYLKSLSLQCHTIQNNQNYSLYLSNLCLSAWHAAVLRKLTQVCGTAEGAGEKQVLCPQCGTLPWQRSGTDEPTAAAS